MTDQLTAATRIARYINENVKVNETLSVLVNRDISELSSASKKAGMASRISCITRIVLRNSDYASALAVKLGVAAGVREPVVEKSYLRTVEIEGVPFKEHKTKGTFYIGLPVMSFGIKTWRLDGVECSKEDLRPYFIASAFKVQATRNELKDQGQTVYRSPKVENIMELV
jgi:hypothetical protein